MLNSTEQSTAPSMVTAPMNGDISVGATNEHSLQQPSYHDIICSHLHQTGFIQGRFSDMILHLNINEQHLVFKLHKVIVYRSPTLANLLANSSEDTTAYNITSNDKRLTADGISIALGHLYSSYSHTILNQQPKHRSVLLRSVLAAANLFGLVDLASHVKNLIIKSDINKSTILDYCHFVAKEPEIVDAVFMYLCRGVLRDVKSDSSVSSTTTTTTTTTIQDSLWPEKTSQEYGSLCSLFAELPFEWLKKVIESKSFDVASELQRYHFAKDVVSLRANKSPTGYTDENVLLAFGASNQNTGVTLVRKAQKQQHHQPQQQQQQQHHHKSNNSSKGASGLNTPPSQLVNGGVHVGNNHIERRVWKVQQ